MTGAVDYAGRTFGELTGVRRVGRGMWLWQCGCGRQVTAKSADVAAGRVVSCGHVLRESARRRVVEDNVLGHVDGTSLAVLRGIVRGTGRKESRSGVRGVRARRTADGRVRYEARIVYRRKEVGLGTYDTLEEAAAARRRAEEEMYAPVLRAHGWMPEE